jgi:magnesium chelatase family protein
MSSLVLTSNVQRGGARHGTAAGLKLFREAADAMRLSARGYTRVLRVARTLADLDGAATVSRVHLAEAISYRTLIDEVRRAAVA